MEYWKSKWEEYSERCDFQGLAKPTEKLDEIVKGELPYDGHRSYAVINGSTFKKLSAISNRSSLSLPAFINLAWHKTLFVYGNGVHTITATNLASYDRKLIPLIMDHSKPEKNLEKNVLREIEMELKNSFAENLSLYPSELWDSFCDSLILWGDDADYHHQVHVENVPLILNLRMGHNNNEAYDVTISYNFNLFDANLIDGILEYFGTVVEKLLVHAECENLVLSSIDFLPQQQKNRIEQWNNETSGNFPDTKRLHHLVEEAAQATPENLAVVCQETCLTYRELNEKSNQLGHLLHLREGVKVEQFIALFLDKTETLLMTILGIWKCGAAYIPIDPTYPDERVKFILEDTNAKFVITNERRHKGRLLKLLMGDEKFENLKILEVEKLLAMAENEPVNNLNLTLRSTQLAYVTYTSGTTGVPKGVYKEHKGVVNSITDLSIRYEMRQNIPEVVALFSAYVFEPFIRQTLIALVNSQLLVIADDNEKLDPSKFLEFLNKHRVTYLNGTASVLQEYDLSQCTTLRKLILVGEELTKNRYANLRKMYKGRIICEYGFTESALVSCMNTFDLEDERTNRSIGRPLRNVKAYIVNSSNLQPLPIGAIGELYVGGVGISRGYMNRDALTKERFLVNPFQTEQEKAQGINHLMYKTGDLARWLENGQIEYIGRNDFQIKLRGNRIEPAEIESVVLQYRNVTKCTVAVKDSKQLNGESSRHLVGYFVANEHIAEEDIIAYLEQKLPRYMIPVRMVQIAEIRTNINGKVDLKALPEVEFTKALINDRIHESRNDVDTKLIEVWGEALGIPENKIGIEDDFFRLGGHSITCIQLIARIRQNFGCDVTIEHIFSLRSIKKLSDYILTERASDIKQNNGENKTLLSQIKQQDVSDEILANSLHQGLVYHYLKQGRKDDAYVMQSHYRYNEAINSSLYKRAWEMARAKYPSLRLNFKVQKEVYQVFKPPSTPLDYAFTDICHKDDKQTEIDSIIKMDRERRYDLESGNLFRVYLIKEDECKYSMVFSYHHIIFDGWSIPILFAFVHQIYGSLLQGSTPQKSLTSDDTAYVLSQQHLEIHRKDHLEYWTSQVEQIDQRVNLSGLLKDEIKYKVQINNYDHIENQKQFTKEINVDLVQKLQTFGMNNGVTLHSILQFVWHKVLYAYGGGRNTVVGTTVSGRNIPIDGVENSVGLFINTLPLVVDHLSENDLSYVEAVKVIQRKMNAMNCKSNVELGKLGSGSGELKHSMFDSLFVLEPKMDLKESFGFKLVRDYEKLDYPLAVIAREQMGMLKFTLCYAGELFEDQVIADILDMVEYFLNQIVSNPEQTVKSLSLVLPRQVHLMEKWNETKRQFPADKTLHEMFEEAAKSNLNKIVLIYEDIKWTYDKFNKKANQLANHLRSLVTINPDDKIALILDKNDLVILSIVGVWKSGAAFVPIDPSYPDERIQFMLNDTEAKVVIVNSRNEEWIEKIVPNGIKIVGIENTIEHHLPDYNQSNLARISCSTDLCYVIYTSGTSGRPKGVMTEHRGVVNLHDSLTKLFDLKSSNKEEVLLSFSNFVFDHFVEQMTDAILSGQTLVILNDDMRSDKERLYKYIKDNKVTYLSGTPSVLSLYEYEDLKTITRIDAVGEDFTEALFNKIRSNFSSGIIINGYGPTEVSITSHKRIYKVGEGRKNKSIGHQMYNSTCYVLNEFGQRVPIGAVGELYLGGVGVGRGYLNREDLTSKAFIQNPFTTVEDKIEGRNLRVYRTGDLARFLPNGEVECLGRNDFQVKIRGLRIELSEIEAAVLSYHQITQCVVVAQNHEESVAKFLVGYYTSNETLNERSILSFIQNKLPAFMMPNRLVQVDVIPVTINGKCDTKKLPRVTQFVQDRHLDENLNEIETKLRYIWSELLRLPAELIGIEDDFFSLGGDSLSVISMTFMINKVFEKIVGVPQVFLNKSIKSLGHFINESGYHQSELIKIESNVVPASLAQERLLYIDEMENCTAAFNIPFVFKLKSGVDANLLMESLKLVALRHQSLRTLLIKYQDSYGQKIVTGKEFESLWSSCIATKKVRSNDEYNKEISSAENYIFKLDEELPLRVKFFNDIAGRSESYVSIVFHHTCFDGWSFAIFKRDWLAFYHHLHQSDGETIALNLPALNYQYKDFAVLQKNLLNDDKLDNLKSYWLKKLANAEQLNLPTDFDRPLHFSYSGYEIFGLLDRHTTTSLKTVAKSLKTSLFSVLTSAFALTLNVYTGQEDVLIGTPVSNRMRSEFENVIGFFVNILPLRITVNQDFSVTEFVESVGVEVVSSHVNQDLPLEKLVKELKIEKDSSRHPLVQVLLNFNPLVASMNDENGGNELMLERVEQQCRGRETTAKYDLSVTVTETTNAELDINFTFAKTLYRESTVEAFMDTFMHILSMFSKPNILEQKINELDLVSKHPSSGVTTTNLPYPVSNGFHTTDDDSEDTTLSKMFQNIAMQCGTETALVYEDRHITYDELNIRSNQVARMLRNVCTGRFANKNAIALFMDKTDWMITSILGVWKSGCAYVPIDPSYPTERVKFILKDTEAKVIVTNQSNESRLKEICNVLDNEFEIVTIDSSKTIAGLKQLSHTNLKNNCRENDLCYIIYTSGSTGSPKGVMISHKNVVSFRESLLQYHKRREHVLLLSNFVFDFSIEQIVLSIFNWGKLIIINELKSIDDQFYSYLNQEYLTYLSGTPSVITALDLSKLQYVKTITVAGEKFQHSHFTKIRNEFNGKLINAYGVTETTVYNSIYIFGANDSYKNSLGQFFDNTTYYLLDKKLRRLPRGAVGELYLSGTCVAQGYLNRTEMMRKCFVTNPFYDRNSDGDTDDATLYRTGDLVRLTVSGDLEYLGRNDNQIKIRGFRIELDEIECTVLRYQKVKQCCVISENNCLVCIFVNSGSSNDDIRETLKLFLENNLPSFMVPQLLQYTGTSLPVTVNGKLDISVLKDFYRTANCSFEIKYTAPRDKLENDMCKIFSSVLNLPIEAIGIDHDFFDLGGDSISSLILAGKIRNQLGLQCSVKNIFDQRSIRRLSTDLGHRCATLEKLNGSVTIDQSIRPSGAVELLPIQKWFFTKNLKSLDRWNQTFSIEVPSELDVTTLTQSILALVNHHDAFRLRFNKNVDGYTQHYENIDKFDFVNFHQLNVTGLSEKEVNRKLSKLSVFDIAKGPLYTVVYLYGDNSACKIWWSIHHLIVDSVSWRIIKDDLQSLYEGRTLSPKGTSYKEFSTALTNQFLPEKPYWDSIVDKVQFYNLNFPKSQKTKTLTKYEFSLDESESQRLISGTQRGALSKINRINIQDFLLAAVGLSLKKITNSATNYVTLEGHGREQIDSNFDISNTVGWFTTMYPMEIHTDSFENITSCVRQLNKSLSSIPNKGIGYGAIFGYTDPVLPCVSFNYLGNFGASNSAHSEWNFCDLSLGLSSEESEKVSSTVLDITGAYCRGCLTFSININLDPDDSKAFVGTFKETLEQMANNIENIVPQPPFGNFETYYEFSANTSTTTTLFILPPGEGGAESYFNNLVPSLKEFNLVVFNNFYLERQPMEMTFEKLAAMYIVYIKAIQVDGPYNFLGWSFGGVLALEICRQMTNSGDHIHNLFFIDSYLDVTKAVTDLNIGEDSEIIDRINYKYNPTTKDFGRMCPELKNIVLFKATLLNEMHKSIDQRRLYEYYQETTYNNLDNLIPSHFVQVIKLEKHTHNTWAKDKKQVNSIANVVTEKLQKL